MESRGKTLFVDIDGTIFKHMGNATGACFDPVPFEKGDPDVSPWYLLSAVCAVFNNWCSKGYRIILTTGRNESMREVTEKQLRYAGLFWDMLIMGIGGGERILINDMSTNNLPKAIAINVTRDEGFENIDTLYSKSRIAAGYPQGEYTI